MQFGDACLTAHCEAYRSFLAADLGFIWVDANQAPGVLFREITYGGDVRTGTDFHAEGALYATEPVLELALLGGCAPFDPLPIAEHQDVGPRQCAAAWADGQGGKQLTVFSIDFRLEVFCRPNGVIASRTALQVVN